MGQEIKDELTGNQKKIYEMAMAAITDTRPERDKNLFDLFIEDELFRLSEVNKNDEEIES